MHTSFDSRRSRLGSRLPLIAAGIAAILIFALLFSRLGDASSGSARFAVPDRASWAGEELPLQVWYVREAFDREVLINSLGDYQTALYLKRAPKYFPFIEAELEKRGMPDDLKYLSVAESGLREVVASSAGAAGLWQFMPDTARRYGLRVDADIDERLHFEKATLAALSYLSDLYRQFGSWHLAAAAYNRGENGLAGDIERNQQSKYTDLQLNSETANYIFRIAGIAEVMRDPARFGFEIDSSQAFGWPAFENRLVTGPVDDLAGWARGQGSTLRAVRELNPWILKSSLPAGSWQVRVPVSVE